MNDLEILDNHLDKREFRNYISTILYKFDYTDFEIDDVRLSDDDETNDNDLIAFKDGMKYTIQTFLNNDITENEINETIEDMKHEHVSYGTIITNKEVSDEIRKIAFNNGIEIIDRKELKKSLSKECCK